MLKLKSVSRYGPVEYEQRIVELIESDQLRMRALLAVKTLNLPHWLIAAGFVRNKVWSSIYGGDVELNDIDVIYYCRLDTSQQRDSALEQQLNNLEPELPWSVKNQAHMHLKNDDPIYKSTLDAMSYWPEVQTAIGVRLDDKDDITLQCCFGFNMLFNGQINRNPARSIEVFNNRLRKKERQKLWPKLQSKI